MRRNGELIWCDVEVEQVSAIDDLEAKLAEFAGDGWIQPQCVFASFDPGEAALDEVDVLANVLESQIRYVHKGDPIRIEIPALPDRVFTLRNQVRCCAVVVYSVQF